MPTDNRALLQRAFEYFKPDQIKERSNGTNRVGPVVEGIVIPMFYESQLYSRDEVVERIAEAEEMGIFRIIRVQVDKGGNILSGLENILEEGQKKQLSRRELLGIVLSSVREGEYTVTRRKHAPGKPQSGKVPNKVIVYTNIGAFLITPKQGHFAFSHTYVYDLDKDMAQLFSIITGVSPFASYRVVDEEKGKPLKLTGLPVPAAIKAIISAAQTNSGAEQRRRFYL